MGARPGGCAVSFGSLGEFLAMGGHGLYVWLSYGVALVVVLANVFTLARARRRQWLELEDQLRRSRGAAEAGGAALANVAENDR